MMGLIHRQAAKIKCIQIWKFRRFGLKQTTAYGHTRDFREEETAAALLAFGMRNEVLHDGDVSAEIQQTSKTTPSSSPGGSSFYHMLYPESSSLSKARKNPKIVGKTTLFPKIVRSAAFQLI